VKTNKKGNKSFVKCSEIWSLKLLDTLFSLILESKLDKYITKVSLATSEGCIVAKPRSIHLLEPLISGMKRTINNKRTVNIIIGITRGFSL
jgi:hypothetical protein